MLLLFFLFFLSLPFQFALSPAPGVDLHISRLFAIAIFFVWLASSLFRKSLSVPFRSETILLVSFLFLSGFSILFAEHADWGLRKFAFLLSFVPLFFVSADILSSDKKGGFSQNSFPPLLPFARGGASMYSSGRRGFKSEPQTETTPAPLPACRQAGLQRRGGKHFLGGTTNFERGLIKRNDSKESIRNFRRRFFGALAIGSGVSAVVGIVQFFLPSFIGLDPALRIWTKHLLPFFSGSAVSETIAEYSSMVANVGGTNVFRASAFFPDPHIASFFWGMTLPVAVFLAFSEKKKNLKRFWKILSALILLADLFTFSRGGLVALIVAGLVALVRFAPTFAKRQAPVLLFALFGIALFFLIPNPIESRLRSSFDTTDHSTSGRLAIWQEATAIIAKHPVLGVGLGNYSNTVKPSADYREPRYAHNLFLDIAAETGIVTAILFFAFVATVIIRAFRNGNDTNASSIAVGFALIVFSAHTFFETPLYSVHILPLFLVLSTFVLATPETKPPQTANPKTKK